VLRDDHAGACLKLLRRYAAELDEVMNLYAGRTLHGDQRQVAQSRFRTLKESLKAEHKRLQSADRNGQLNDIEERFYYPAIHESLGEVSSLRWHAIPNEKWHTKLYSSRTTIKQYLHVLKSATER
jgi:hypothetical protein